MEQVQETLQECFEAYCQKKHSYSTEESIRMLKDWIKQAESAEYKEHGLRVPVIAFNHVVECYYYGYEQKNWDFACAKTSLNRMLRELAELYQKSGDWELAEQAGQKAILWNPVDPESYFTCADLYRDQENLPGYLQMTQKAYRYCNSRPLLARYYRKLGCYYLETYQPELSRAVYEYSEIYSPSECARNELQYLAAAMNWEPENRKPDTLRQILRKHQIPTEMDPVIVALTYQAAKTEAEKGHTIAAGECYELFYHQMFQKKQEIEQWKHAQKGMRLWQTVREKKLS